MMIYPFYWVQHSDDKNKPLPHTAAQKNLTDRTLGKKKLSMKSIYWMVPFIEGSVTGKTNPW